MRVLLHYDADHSEIAAREPQLDIAGCPEEDDGRFYELLGEAEVLWHVLRPITAEDLERAPKLRLIQKLGTGVNTIDLDAAAARGIAVANMPGTNAQAVAEAALLLTLATLRRVVEFDARTRAGRGWPADPSLTGGEIAGRTVGLLGGGQIAMLLRGMLEAVGAEVVYTSRTPRAGDPAWRPLEEMLRVSDILSVHVPLTEETHHLLDERRLGLLPEGAVVVNTSRGAVVDESALVAALRSGRLAGAGLDVFEKEPAGAGNPLFGLGNVVVMPHVAWLTRETWARYFAVAAENCRRLAAGGELLHRVR